MSSISLEKKPECYSSSEGDGHCIPMCFGYFTKEHLLARKKPCKCEHWANCLEHKDPCFDCKFTECRNY